MAEEQTRIFISFIFLSGQVYPSTRISSYCCYSNPPPPHPPSMAFEESSRAGACITKDEPLSTGIDQHCWYLMLQGWPPPEQINLTQENQITENMEFPISLDANTNSRLMIQRI